MVTGVQHEHGGEADGQVVGVHLVPAGLGGHRGQMVQQMNQAVLKIHHLSKVLYKCLRTKFMSTNSCSSVLIKMKRVPRDKLSSASTKYFKLEWQQHHTKQKIFHKI